MAGLYYYDRLVPGKAPGRADEFARVADRLHIDHDAPRLGVFTEKIDEIAKIDIDHGTEGDEHAEPYVGVCRPVEQHAAQ